MITIVVPLAHTTVFGNRSEVINHIIYESCDRIIWTIFNMNGRCDLGPNNIPTTMADTTFKQNKHKTPKNCISCLVSNDKPLFVHNSLEKLCFQVVSTASAYVSEDF